MLSKELEKTLNKSFKEAREKRHEFMTVEHLLLAILSNDKAAHLLRACAADLTQLGRELNAFIDQHTPLLPLDDSRDTQPTLGFQRVLQRAVFHVQSSGTSQVTGAHVLVALFGEQESHSVFLLAKQEISRIDAVNVIAHGITKLSGDEADDWQKVDYQEDEVKNTGSFAIAIDFGTSRTKVGWRDNCNQINELMWNGSPYLPSVFHLPPGCSEILIGDMALEAIEEDPQGGIENFKRQILEDGAMGMTYPDRHDNPEAVVARLFEKIRQACLDQIPGLGGQLPESVTLTQPACASSQWRDLLEHGAEAAGFLKVEAFKEPIAAARGWLYTQSIRDDAIIMVLDCGGGTTDWAVIEWRNGRPNLSRDHKPQSLTLGGSDVDRALLKHVNNQNNDLVAQQASNRLLNKLKSYKDRILTDEPCVPLRIGGRLLSLDADIVKDIYQRVFVGPLMLQFIPKLELAKNSYPKLRLLLTGGSVHESLIETLKNQSSETSIYVRSDGGLGVLRGALVQF